MGLNTRTKRISGVIDFPQNKINKEIISKLEAYLKNNGSEWHYILHDNEANLITGEIKVNHLHFLMVYGGEQREKRISTYINEISDFLNIGTNLISVRTWREYELGIQYLIHKNDKDKQPYLPSDIITSLTKEELDFVLNRQIDTCLSINYIVYLCENCTNLTEIYCNVGLTNARMYRALISDIWHEVHNGKSTKQVKYSE